MIRVLRRPRGTADIRIWQPPDWPLGHARDAGIAIEWQRQAGHPTSYGLLGGAVAEEVELAVEPDGPDFAGSLAGTADQVRFGLPDEYRASTLDALRLALPHSF
jgi:hypothetical protein